MVKVEVNGKNILEIPCVDIPERSLGRNARLRPSFTNTSGTTSRTTKTSTTLNWHTVEPRVVITSDTDDFDQEIISQFQEEGFQVSYLPYSGDHAAYHRQLDHLADPLELGETYALVAYGDAAALVLESAMKPTPKLCAVVAYYPPHMPKTSTNFPRTLNLTIHLAASQKFGTRHQRNYRYPNTQDGFAESDLEEYDKAAARVAWSRTLTTLRRGFGIDPDLEAIWDYHTHLRDNEDDREENDVDDLMKTMTKDASVNHVPTMTGGHGHKQLRRFYAEFWGESRPSDFKTKLLSRTAGVDKIVDEMLVSFTHNTEIHWMLPGIPPTGKEVEVPVVVIVGIRGGKICSENVHWDQASVLMQVGLLDPKYVPGDFETKQKGEKERVKKLPVLGAEAARKAADEEKGKCNRLIPGWSSS